MNKSNVDEVLNKLHLQTSTITWQELEPHYARDVVLHVSHELDLVKIALAFVQDETSVISGLIDSGKVQKLSIKDAKQWSNSSTFYGQLWAVVVSPWVLVQPVLKSVNNTEGK